MEIDDTNITNNGKKAQYSSWDPATRTSSIDTDRMTDIRNDDQLHIAQTKETKSERPKIPATFFEKLSFYRSFTSSPSKTQIIYSQQIEFNRFFWYHIINVFCKSLPSTYVYMFLSVYVPNQHLFLSKMIPIAYGSNWAFLGAGLINLITYTDVVIILFDYVICGILYKDPWNRCPENYFKGRICYNIQDFSRMLQNETLFFHKGQYKTHKNVSIDLAPFIYYRTRWAKMINVDLYFVLIWVLAALHYRQLFKRYIWKALHILQLLLTVTYVANFGFLLISYFESELKSVNSKQNEVDEVLWDADLGVLSESMTAPALIHIITSRSIEKIQPEHGSSAVVFSNTAYFIFRGMLAYRLKKHCENMLKIPILYSEFNPNSFFYLWPIYFSTFHLGNFYTVLYFLLLFMVEFLTITISIQCFISFFQTISIQCFIETIVYEWKWAKREIVTVLIIIFGISYKMFTHFRVRLLLYIYGVSFATLFEVLVLYCVYPLGRLVDDITFFYGSRPTMFRIINMQLVPMFYTLKMYGVYKGFFRVVAITHWAKKAPYYIVVLYIVLVPFILGAIYATVKSVYVDKKNFKYLFKPIPEWGPKDRVLRQLRKKFDSRYYVDSQVPRKLSRYMIQKSSLESYKLDVMYDNYSRRSSINAAEIRREDEKKRK